MTTVTKESGGYRRKETRTTDLDAVIFNSSVQWHTKVQCNADGVRVVLGRGEISENADKEELSDPSVISRLYFFFFFLLLQVFI